MLRALVTSCFLVGCAAPTAHFRDAQVTRVAVAGSAFDVRIKGGLAEAVRHNPEYAPRMGRVAARAAVAMEQVSGCRIRGIMGDAAVILGILDCEAPD